MKFKTLLCFLIVFGICFDIDELTKSLKQNVNGDFNQTKNIIGLQNSIKSSGEFSIKKDEFILNTLKPIKNTTKIDKNGVFIIKNGEWVKSDRSVDLGLLLSIINVDIAALKSEFDTKLSGNNSNWHIMLLPKGFMVSKIFKSIEISGGEYVKKIKLTEVNGDESISEFSIK